MTDDRSQLQLRALLDEIQQVLDDEREALRVLDMQGIEFASQRKAELEVRLRTMGGMKLDDADRQRVHAIRTLAQANQLLLVHARSCVRGALSLATGQPVDPYQNPTRNSAAPATAMRVNVRG